MLRDEHNELPRLDRPTWRRAHPLLCKHHDLAYAPAYLEDMVAPDTEWTPTMDKRFRHHALTPRSIIIAVQLEEPTSFVVTAFRPHPPTRGVRWTEAEFRRQSTYYFQTMLRTEINDIASLAAQRLTQASAHPPTSVQDAWWLASAVGFARLLPEHSMLRGELSRASDLLATLDEPLRAQLGRALDWNRTLGRLADGLRDDRPESLEYALANAEELLIVAAVIDERQAATEFLANALTLLPQLPADWNHLTKPARARCSLLGGEESLPGRLWTAVVAAATNPAPSLLHQWQRRVASLGANASTAIRDWIHEGLNTVSVVTVAPAMTAAPEHSAGWQVRARPTEELDHFQAFIVDAEHPDGYEITDVFHATDGYLWQLERADETALIILVAAESPWRHGALADVLAIAAGRDDMAVGYRRVSPPR